VHYHILAYLGREQFIDDALGAHNEYRVVHGVPPLVNDKTLNAQAQKHADKLARKSINDVAMSKTLGESIYTSCDGVVTGRSVTEAW
jgi:metal-dependent amidase/aminoacylase/carboxypeptidase family protein